MKRRLFGAESEFGLECSKDAEMGVICDDYKTGAKHYPAHITIARTLPKFLKENPLGINDFDSLFLRRCKSKGKLPEGLADRVVDGYGDSCSSYPASVLFLQNGGKFYYDVGHAECATPECDNLVELVAYEHAMTLVFDAVVRKFAMAHPEKGVLQGYKDCTDGEVFWGSHANYLVERQVLNDGRLKCLIPFLVTQQLFTGPGYVRDRAINPRFRGFDSFWELSPRARAIKMVFGYKTTEERAIINSRDEPFADRKKYARLHLIHNDANMLGYTNFLKFGTTHLVLRLIEEIEEFDTPGLNNPVNDMHNVSLHPHQPLTFKGGRKMMPIEIQRKLYLEPYRKYLFGDDEQSDNVLKLWEFVLNEQEDSRTKLPLSLVGIVDGVTKYEFLSQFIEADKLDPSNEEDRAKLRGCNNLYHNISVDAGLTYTNFRGENYKPSNPAEVLNAIFSPPLSTRAGIRAFPIRFFPERISSVDWDRVIFDKGSPKLNLTEHIFAEPDKLREQYDKPDFEIFKRYCYDRDMLEVNKFLK